MLTVGDLPYTQQSQYTAATDFVDNAGAGAVVSVVILLGANDSKPYNWDTAGRPEQYKTDYLALVDHFLGLKTKPVVYVAYPLATGTNPCCSIRGDVMHDEQVPLIEQVAQMRKLPIIDLNTPTTNHPEYFGDGVHPNDAGYLVLAQLVKAGLEREPTVNIAMPAMGASLAAGPIPLTATASGGTVDIASVEFFDGPTSLGKVMAPPFTFDWQAGAGAHQLTAKAVDTTLADATSDPVTVTVGGGAAGGPGGGGGGGGGAGAGTSAGGAGSGTGGTAAGGVNAAGSPASGGTGGTALGNAGSSGSGAPLNPATPPAADAGCSCALPQRSSAGTWLALTLALLAARRRRRSDAS